MLKILLLDDEEASVNMLKLLIEKYVQVPLTMQCYTNPVEALNALKSYQPDLVFIDIEMPEMNGFYFLSQAAAYDFDIIFTTAFDHYAIRAIRFSALDYLLKPIDAEELQNAINRHIMKKSFPKNIQRKTLVKNLMHNLEQAGNAPPRLSVSVAEGVFLLNLPEILCLEGQNNYTRFFLTNQKPLTVSRTLKDYEDILQDYQFMRVHKSWLVNVHHIKKIDAGSTLWLSNHMQIPVSRRRKNEVYEMIQSGRKGREVR